MDKERLNILKKDQKVLSYFAKFHPEGREIKDIEKNLEMNFKEEILPIAHKYDIYHNILKEKIFVWKAKVRTIVKEVEEQIDTQEEKISKKSFWKNPNPWIKDITLVLISGVIGFILGRI